MARRSWSASARGEAGTDNRDLHGLLLEERHAERLLERGAQLRPRVLRPLESLAPAQVGVDHVALDRPGSHDRDLNDEVVEAARLHARQHQLDGTGARLIQHGRCVVARHR